jgi:hypothetical protein
VEDFPIDTPLHAPQTEKTRLEVIWLEQRRLSVMSTTPPPDPGSGAAGRRIEEAIELIELEVRHAIAYINDAVIPQVRSESISALRTVSKKLHNLADRIEQTKNTSGR